MSEKTTQPHNLEAERAVLGAILISASAFFRVDPIMSADDFYRDAHRRLYAVMSAISRGGEHADSFAVRSALHEDELRALGGFAYISSLQDGIPDIARIERYARMVVRESRRRRLIEAGNLVMQRAMGDDEEPEAIAAEALAAFTPTATREDAQAQPFGGVIREAYDNAEKRRVADTSLALRTGLYELDSYGVVRRTFVVVGSPSKHGKSAFAVSLAAGLADNGHTVGLLTLESTPEEIVWRHIASVTGIPHGKVQDWRVLGSGDFERLAKAESLAQKLPIFITRSVRTIEAIDAEARRLKAVSGLDVLLLDYIQLVRFPNGPRDREERMAEIASWLLNLALELKIAVIATSQVNKERLERQDGRLYPSDLKYAAAIGESARVVLMFQRPHVDNPKEPSCKVLFQVAAANEGRTGSYAAHFDETIQRFTDGDCDVNGCRNAETKPEPKSKELFGGR